MGDNNSLSCICNGTFSVLPTSSQIMTQRLIIDYEGLVLPYAYF